MELKHKNVTIILPDNTYPNYTIDYVMVLLNAIEKGLENPALQLHVLSALSAGPSFPELMLSIGTEEMQEMFVQQMKSSIENMIPKTKKGLSGQTIDDILGKLGQAND